jgi:hypothetical protein
MVLPTIAKRRGLKLSSEEPFRSLSFKFLIENCFKTHRFGLQQFLFVAIKWPSLQKLRRNVFENLFLRVWRHTPTRGLAS